MSKKSANEKKSDESFSLLTDFDIHLFKSGKHFKLHEKLGAHVVTHHGQKGTYFAVWAPNARLVSVIGNFNQLINVVYTFEKKFEYSKITNTRFYIDKKNNKTDILHLKIIF